MPTTAEELVKACFWDLLPGIPVVADYFGNAEDEEEERIVFGIYQGLVKFKGVDHDLLFNCFLSDRLDELVHAKYKHGKTGYYQKFCQKNISLKTQTLHRKLPKSYGNLFTTTTHVRIPTAYQSAIEHRETPLTVLVPTAVNA